MGRKRAFLFPPSDYDYIYPIADKSAVTNLDSPDYDRYPHLSLATAHRAVLNPGDAVFIPALWYHNMRALDFSVAVNLFWKGLEDECYDKKDPYGNKDPAAVARATQSVDKALQHLRTLPLKYSAFYGRRLARVLEEKSAVEAKRDLK